MIDPTKIAEHVKDADCFELPFQTHILIPQPFEAIGLKFHLTKFMVLEVVAAVMMLAIFIPLAYRLRKGAPPRGRFCNMFEAMLMFLRDKVARPSIGRRDADRFVPFIWTLFFFILFCNLLGLVPWAGSPTGEFAVTITLAFIAFCTTIGAGMKKYGVVKFWTGLSPPMDLPLLFKISLVPMILFIEILGLLIRHLILAIRLLANMFAGHFVLAVILAFIANCAASLLWYGVMPASVLGATAINMLELFVAFLHAYIFSFLTALFIGMAVHQH